jgi:uncharacterized OB-fold protein
MNTIFERTFAKGWQCPICKHVFSPFTPMCHFCPNKKKVKFEFEKGSEPIEKEAIMFLKP